MVLYAVSDATGELAIALSTAVIKQFQSNLPVIRRGKVRSKERMEGVLQEAKTTQGLVVYTIVSKDVRDWTQKRAEELQVPVVDVMGPLLETMGQYLKVAPSDQPGLKYEFSRDYLRRNEAIEFTVKHDDGNALETIDESDIILLGISRTSKTPLSIYLAYRGYKTANVPLILDMPVSPLIKSANPKKMIGLTISPDKLVDLRSARLSRLGISRVDRYSDLNHINDEVDYARHIFQDLGKIPVINVTTKAIEEVATEIISVMGLA